MKSYAARGECPWINLICYVAGNVSQQRAVIVYFEVRWHLTMKLFPAKISVRETLQDLWRQRVTVYVDQRPPLERGLMNFQLQNFQLYNKLHKNWSRGKQLILFDCFPRDQSLSVFTKPRPITAIVVRAKYLHWKTHHFQKTSDRSFVSKKDTCIAHFPRLTPNVDHHFLRIFPWIFRKADTSDMQDATPPPPPSLTMPASSKCVSLGESGLLTDYIEGVCWNGSQHQSNVLCFCALYKTR